MHHCGRSHGVELLVLKAILVGCSLPPCRDWAVRRDSVPGSIDDTSRALEERARTL